MYRKVAQQKPEWSILLRKAMGKGNRFGNAVRIPCNLQLPFQRHCNMLEFEPLIMHDICNTLVLRLFMLDCSVQLGAI